MDLCGLHSLPGVAKLLLPVLNAGILSYILPLPTHLRSWNEDTGLEAVMQYEPMLQYQDSVDDRGEKRLEMFRARS